MPLPRRLLPVLFLAAALALPAAAAQAAPAPVPCTDGGGGYFNCQWYVAGDGQSGGAPVLDSAGKRVGYLHKGTNWIICQRAGAKVTSGQYYNDNWGWTEADDKAMGWVNAVWASGGDNDGPFAKAPACGTAHGNPPATPTPPSGGGGGGGAAPPTAPTPPTTPPTAPSAPASGPAPVPCKAIGHGRFNCSWRIAGNGHSGGSPVVNGNGQTVGYLHQGANWVTCQQTGRQETSGQYYNNNWAWTTADDRKAGWVNALWAHGGDNDGAFAGVPACAGAHGAPPQSGATPPQAPKQPKPIRTAPKRTCSDTRQDEYVTASFTIDETWRHIVEPGNVALAPLIHNDKPERHTPFGSITIGASTCKTASGWQVNSPVSITAKSVGQYKDGDGHAAPSGGGSAKGWGLAPRQVKRGVFDVQMSACRKATSGWGDAISFLAAIPIPTAHYVIAAAQWGFNEFVLPHLVPAGGVKCADMGSYALSVSADATGRLHVTAANESFGAIDVRTDLQPGVNGNYYEHDKEADAPVIKHA